MVYYRQNDEGEAMPGTDCGHIAAIKHLPKIEIKNTLLSLRF
jgi:hypothetical protein